AQPIAEPSGEDIDLPALQPSTPGKELQIGGRQRYVALNGLRPGRRNRQLHQQCERQVLVHRLLCEDDLIYSALRVSPAPTAARRSWRRNGLRHTARLRRG